MIDHSEHGRGDPESGPDDPDCACRGTESQAACAEAGCGFCRVAPVVLTPNGPLADGTRRISLSDGKYEFISEASGKFRCLRYGEEWRDLTGDRAVHALFDVAQRTARTLMDEPLIKVEDDPFYYANAFQVLNCLVQSGDRIGISFSGKTYYVMGNEETGYGESLLDALNNYREVLKEKKQCSEEV